MQRMLQTLQPYFFASCKTFLTILAAERSAASGTGRFQ
jgi:hypothetical protein